MFPFPLPWPGFEALGIAGTLHDLEHGMGEKNENSMDRQEAKHGIPRRARVTHFRLFDDRLLGQGRSFARDAQEEQVCPLAFVRQWVPHWPSAGCDGVPRESDDFETSPDLSLRLLPSREESP